MAWHMASPGLPLDTIVVDHAPVQHCSLPPLSLFVAFEWTFSIFDFEFGVACETFLRLGCVSIKNPETKTNA